MKKKEEIDKITIDDIAMRLQSDKAARILYYDTDILCLKSHYDENYSISMSVLNTMSTLVFCLSGSMKLQLVDRAIEIGERDVVFIRPQTLILNKEVSKGFRGYWLGLNTNISRRLLRLDSGLQQIIYYLITHSMVKLTDYEGRIIEAYFRLIEAKVPHIRYYGKETIGCIIRAIFLDFFSHVREELLSNQVPIEPVRSSVTIFLKFQELLFDHNCVSRKVSHYADLLCISSKYLSFVCRSNCGRTASALINEAMAENIKYYLEYTTLSVKEISILLDFPSLSFFGRYVKKHLGKSPNAYRAEFKNNQ